MTYPARYALLLDGGFLIKKHQGFWRRFPEAEDIQRFCDAVKAHPDLQDLKLMRTYFYHAPPAKDRLTNPLDHSTVDLAATPIFRLHERLMDRLELMPDFALRLGETVTHNWRLGSQAMNSLMRQPRQIQAGDLVPNITQKGVDLRIGLDIARLSLQRMVQTIVIATGDSDLVPAFKFARREGVQIYLLHLDHGIRRELKAHGDRVLDVRWPRAAQSE